MNNNSSCSEKIDRLLKKGVAIPAPNSIEVGDDVDVERICGDGVLIHAGSRICGAATHISAGAVIGCEGPVTIENCQIGPAVRLGSGFFKQTVFLSRSGAGANCHAREGTILEEGAGMAHSVGVKQTILFPFVTLGSLINFCDCLMAGGTGPDNHSEVGSSYIHFNFTPAQDKATASLFGDVPRGVMLTEQPIFLGGQGGAVGPLRIAFGTVTAAGTICRKDELISGRLVVGKTVTGGSLSYQVDMYPDINRIVSNNINYIANMTALLRWYEQVRVLFLDDNEFPEALLVGMKDNVSRGIEERIRRLDQLCEKMPAAIALDKRKNSKDALIFQKEELYEKKEVVTELLRWLCKTELGEERTQNEFLEIMERAVQSNGKNYLNVIKSLDSGHSMSGTVWLRSVVDNITDRANDVLPSFTLMTT